MKRVAGWWLGLCLVGAWLVVPASASGVAPEFGVRHACSGKGLRCMALLLTRNAVVVRAASPSALPAGYGPDQYHTAYRLPTETPLVPGTSVHRAVTVAVVDAFDYGGALADLNRFSAAFGLPSMLRCSATVTASCFQKVNLGAPAGSAVAQGWDLEIMLDVETVHEICENCKIVLVEGRSNSFGDLAAAVNRAAKLSSIVSNSYGSYGFDGSQGALDAAYNHPNRAIVVSSGDSGYGVSWPAALNTVVAVGGTTLHLAAGNGYGSETTWGSDGTYAWGTGSGCANGVVSGDPSIPAQPFQSSVSNYSATGCGATRGDNDVAANADPHTGSAMYAASMGWLQVGGTSVSAPLIAAVFALRANATTARYPASLLYAKSRTASFNDVTSGSDDSGNYLPCQPPTTACTAAPGYDLPTGVGTPRGLGGF
jgi:hypothetical protein